MLFKTPNGKEKRCKNLLRYRIDWNNKSRSQFQYRVKQFLKTYWSHHVVFEEFPVVGTRMTLDFFNLTRKIAIEVQGMQHVRYNPFFHNKKRTNFTYQIHRDLIKERFCEENDIKFVTIFENEEINKEIFLKQDIYL
jgi:hypothetical protein